MNISILEHHLKKYLCSSHLPIPEFSFADGVRFFLPAPNHFEAGSLFVGTLIQWQLLLQEKKLRDGCTYLICIDSDNLPNIPKLKTCNILVVKMGVYALVQRINQLIESTSHSKLKDFQPEYIRFWNDVLSDKFEHYDEIKDAMADFPHPVKEYCACIVIRHESYLSRNFSIEEAEAAISGFFNDMTLFYYKNEWILIYSQDSAASDTLDFSYEAFSQILETYSLNAGISYCSKWANLMHTLYTTAAASIDLGTKLSIAPTYKRIYTYYQYNAYYIVHMSYRRFTETHKTSVIYLSHPDAFYLWNKEPELFEVLFSYLRHGRSISETSKDMYMHRNTVNNKIKKIETMLSHSLDSPEYQLLLLLSCMLIKYHSQFI